MWLMATVWVSLCWTPANAQSILNNGYDSSLACIEALHAGLIRHSTAVESGEPAQRLEDLQRLISATHDLRYIAEFTVRRHWDRFGDPERQAFIQRFERLSIMTYASRFNAVEEDTFRIGESQLLASGRAQVTTALRRGDGSDVALEYTLHADADGWRIINVIADGVSDLALKRAEYQRILSDGSVADLIAELDGQIAAL
jgi:phospholipid transport system substrate-binding protein